jgi:hypothetical protein
MRHKLDAYVDGRQEAYAPGYPTVIGLGTG